MTNKKTFFALLITAVMCVPFTTSAQVTIGSGRAPSEWSLLDLCTDVQRKALHNARMTTSQRNDLMNNTRPPAEQLAARGLLIFNINAIEINPNEYIGCLEFWNGITWISLCEDRLPETFGQPPIPTAPICPGSIVNLDAAFEIAGSVNTPLPAGVTYQWEISINGTDWTNAGTGLNLATTPAMFSSNNTSIHVRRTAVHTSTSRTHTVSGVVSLHQQTPFPFVPITLGAGANQRTWAPRNVCFTTHNVMPAAERGFTAHTADPGMFFQWGRRTGWSNFNVNGERRYWTAANQWSAGQGTWHPALTGTDTWPAAQNPCPAGWRVPTAADFSTLVNWGTPLVPRVWVNQYQAAAIGLGCQSGMIIGTNTVPVTPFNYQQHLFLPAAGARIANNVDFGSVFSPEPAGHYWSSSPDHTGDHNRAAYFHIDASPTTHLTDNPRELGFSVRCVRD